MAKYNTDTLTTQHLSSLQIGGGEKNGYVPITDIMESAQLFQMAESSYEVFVIIKNPSYRDLVGSIVPRWTRIDDDHILDGWLVNTTDLFIWVDNLPIGISHDITVKIGTVFDSIDDEAVSVNNWALSSKNIHGFIKNR